MIGVLSVLEGEPYGLVKGLRRRFERKCNSAGVQGFNQPHLSFQGAQEGDLRRVGLVLREVITDILPLEIEVDGVGHFDRKVIYLQVRRTNELTEVHKIINEVLRLWCSDLLDYYTPASWKPHITLAMAGLSDEDFERAWDELTAEPIRFKQQVHNICMVRQYPNGKFRIVRRYRL